MVARAALTVSGIRADGYTERLSACAWVPARVSLLGRRPCADSSNAAWVKHFQGTSWQRCQVHLRRNVFGACRSRVRAEVAAVAQCVPGACDRAEAERALAEFADRFAKTATKSVACLKAEFENTMVVLSLPKKYRKRLRTTHMQERLNEGALGARYSCLPEPSLGVASDRRAAGRAERSLAGATLPGLGSVQRMASCAVSQTR